MRVTNTFNVVNGCVGSLHREKHGGKRNLNKNLTIKLNKIINELLEDIKYVDITTVGLNRLYATAAPVAVVVISVVAEES
jgi:hypothetical protein